MQNHRLRQAEDANKYFNYPKNRLMVWILKFIDNDFTVSLDENGSPWSSKDLSENLSKWMQSFPKVTFIIGGADGLDKKIIEDSNLVWSLSKLTLPHNLVKIILVEQLYRASTILNNHPYHRE